MTTIFKATETVKINVKEQEIPIQEYLSEPRRVVQAIANPKLTEELSEEYFRLKMRPLNFLDFYTFQPTVTLRVWAGKHGAVFLDSQDYDIKGIDAVKYGFKLKVKGKLSPHYLQDKVYLQGKVHLEVKLELPPALLITPKPLLQMAGNGLLKNVLLRIKQQLLKQLLQDYYQWVKKQSTLSPVSLFRLR